MAESNFFDLYFDNSDSVNEFEVFDPKDIIPLWCWI